MSFGVPENGERAQQQPLEWHFCKKYCSISCECAWCSNPQIRRGTTTDMRVPCQLPEYHSHSHAQDDDRVLCYIHAGATFVGWAERERVCLPQGASEPAYNEIEKYVLAGWVESAMVTQLLNGTAQEVFIAAYFSLP